jgi:dienelactone hydrolase
MSGIITLERSAVLVDEPVALSVAGCAPGELVTIEATWRIGDETVRTGGQFVAPPDGVVDPARHDSIGGTYLGVDPYGLWWSIGRQDVPDDPDLLGPWRVEITATGLGWESSAALVRRKVDPQVRQVKVRSGRLRGTAFFPDGDGPHPAVLVYSGSGGGLGRLGGVESTAALLASHGFAAFALAYFRYEDLPPELFDIPLEYFHEAIQWLKVEAPALGGRVAVMGASRGGELSLLLGSAYPDEIAAVIAKVPSGVIWGGIGKEPRKGAVAWTLAGRPIEPIPVTGTDPADLPLRDGAIALTPSFQARLAGASPDELAAAEIPVERVGGPVLLLSGEDDAMWPSAALAEIAVRRAGAKGAKYPFRHIRYPSAGHNFTVPAGLPVALSALHPLSGRLYAYGGSPAGNARASAKAWAEILSFFRSTLLTPASVSSE